MRELLMTLMFISGIYALTIQTAQCLFEFSMGGIPEEEAEDER